DREALKILVHSLLDRAVRLSLDASSLVPEILPEIKDKKVIVTPHAGEFQRLFGEIPPDAIKPRTETVEKYAKEHGITILLKGPTDIVSDGKQTYLNPKNIAAMTVGGTGDVLSGVVASMLAKNKDPVQAASAAVFVNGKAGFLAQKKYGLHIMATDLLDFIPYSMKSFDKVK
ncbi:MAG: ADP-dependent NAD(P)H-hydrate dehydratase, partial [Nitrosotalea sp.]